MIFDVVVDGFAAVAVVVVERSRQFEFESLFSLPRHVKVHYNIT